MVECLIINTMGRNDKELILKARELRNRMTKAEIILWSRIRSRQLDGFRFRRQHPVFDYVVDFYCNELRLIIEVDGEIHSFPENKKADSKRDNFLKINKYNILRLTNFEIETNIDSVIERIKSYIKMDLSPSQGDQRGFQN
jgi:very-short-patch-repair endonuclease